MTRNGTGGLDELSRTLRELRHPPGRSAVLTLEKVAAATGFSISKVNRIERGKTVPTPDDAVTLAKAYGAGAAVRARVRELAEASQTSSKRVVLSRPGREGFQRRLRTLVAQSAWIREFNPAMVPGLLQTPEYTWAIWNGSGGDYDAGAAFVEARQAQQRLLADPGRNVSILLTEGALGWAAGPPDLMLRQLERIADRVDAAQVGVIPFGTPAAEFPISSWTLYDERVVVPGVLGRQVVLNEPADVAPYVTQFDRLHPMAAFGPAAREVLDRVADRYRGLR